MVNYSWTDLSPRNRQYRDSLESALSQLTKQIYGVRENPKRMKLFKSVDILNAEQLVNLRTNRGYSIEKFKNKEAILKCYRSPIVINFLLGTRLSGCRWEGKRWSWGVVADLKHLIEEWGDLANWRSNNKNHSII